MSEGRPEPHGIKGWLLFFILTLTVLGPPWKAWRLFGKWEEIRGSAPEYAEGTEFAALHSVAWATYGVATFLGILVGLILWKRRRASSVKLAVISLWIMGPVISVIGHLIALKLTDLELVFGDLRFLIVPTLSAAIWTAYLLKSRRVKNTYGFSGLLSRNAPDGAHAGLRT